MILRQSFGPNAAAAVNAAAEKATEQRRCASEGIDKNLVQVYLCSCERIFPSSARAVAVASLRWLHNFIISLKNHPFYNYVAISIRTRLIGRKKRKTLQGASRLRKLTLPTFCQTCNKYFVANYLPRYVFNLSYTYLFSFICVLISSCFQVPKMVKWRCCLATWHSMFM